MICDWYHLYAMLCVFCFIDMLCSGIGNIDTPCSGIGIINRLLISSIGHVP